ncbi:MAG TPA: hypothetical protein VLL54_00705, partial [Pyrinomonadaceae bacterium]|nr:hypothetical protein [Pyrinomonadaceae bacterium]
LNINILPSSLQTFHVWLPSFRRFTAKQFTNPSAYDASGMLTPFKRFPMSLDVNHRAEAPVLMK